MRTLNIPIVEHNLHGPDKNPERRRTTIRKFLDLSRGGIGGGNELSSKDHWYIKSEAKKRNLSVFIHQLNVIVWAPSVLRKNSITPKKIMQGGHVGADGVATKKGGDDDRRVGPSRWDLIGDFSPLVDGEVAGDPFDFHLVHLMARAFSYHNWRIPLWRKSVKVASESIRNKRGVFTGDMNNDKFFDLPGVKDVTIKTPATYGKSMNYDQFKVWGGLNIVNIVEFFSPSDHDGLRGTLIIPLGEVTDKPTPTKPPKTVKKYDPRNWRKLGAPIKHPFAKRSAKWKRKHPKLWKRIEAFQDRWNR